VTSYILVLKSVACSPLWQAFASTTTAAADFFGHYGFVEGLHLGYRRSERRCYRPRCCFSSFSSLSSSSAMDAGPTCGRAVAAKGWDTPLPDPGADLGRPRRAHQPDRSITTACETGRRVADRPSAHRNWAARSGSAPSRSSTREARAAKHCDRRDTAAPELGAVGGSTQR
jgi:hypothetical protein